MYAQLISLGTTQKQLRRFLNTQGNMLAVRFIPLGALISILIAILFGGLVGILISEFPKAARPALGVINFLYTIPSISMLGFLIPFSGVGNATAIICIAADGTQYAHGCYECRPLYFGSGERYGKHKSADFV